MPMLVRPPFPDMIDNTMRSAFNSCERKFWLSFIRNWAQPHISHHLLAGQAFALAMETTRKAYYAEGVDPEEAIFRGFVALVESYAEWDDEYWKNKSCFNMCRAFVDYWREYPMDRDEVMPAVFADGKPAIEFNFGIPLPINHPETGMPIIYCGRFDMLGVRTGHNYVVDEKTTGSLGESWSKRYQLSSQFTGYAWGASEHGFPVTGALIRGIGILVKEIKHIQLPLPRPDHMIREWYEAMLGDVRRMIRSWAQTDEAMLNQWLPEIWRPDLADACGEWGGCQFASVCEIDPGRREQMLEINFMQRVWDPMRVLEGGE